jgi:hypothetical protein
MRTKLKAFILRQSIEDKEKKQGIKFSLTVACVIVVKKKQN